MPFVPAELYDKYYTIFLPFILPSRFEQRIYEEKFFEWL